MTGPFQIEITTFQILPNPSVDSQRKDEQPDHERDNDKSLNKAEPTYEYILQRRQLGGESQKDYRRGNDGPQQKRVPLKGPPSGVLAKSAQVYEAAYRHEDENYSPSETVDRAVHGCLAKGSAGRIHDKRTRDNKKEGNDGQEDEAPAGSLPGSKLGCDRARK